MLEMGFLFSSYPETVGVKWPGRKKIFCVFSDTLMGILDCFADRSCTDQMEGDWYFGDNDKVIEGMISKIRKGEEKWGGASEDKQFIIFTKLPANW